MFNTYEDIKDLVGKTIIKREWGGGLRHVVVEAVYEDVKNGEPGFDGYFVDSDGDRRGNPKFDRTWGYADQIVSIVR